MSRKESLEEIASQLKNLEEEREKEIDWIQSLGHEPYERVVLQGEDEKRHLKFKRIEIDIDHLRQKYISQLLTSIDSSSKRLEESIIKLDGNIQALYESPELRLAITAEMKKSSNRLEELTIFLLAVTVLNIWVVSQRIELPPLASILVIVSIIILYLAAVLYPRFVK